MPDELIDERGFNLIRRLREETGKSLTIDAFKKLVREQFLMLLLDERRAVEAIPAMLARDPELASRMIETRDVCSMKLARTARSPKPACRN